MTKKGPKPSGRVGKLSVREAAEMVYAERAPMKTVAERAGVSYQSIYRAFKRYGVPLPGKRLLMGEPIARKHFEMARRLGWSKCQLGRHLGVGHWVVCREQQRLGYSWPERDGKRGKPKRRRG